MGRISLKNISDKDISDVTVSMSVPRFVDFPITIAAPGTIRSGEQVTSATVACRQSSATFSVSKTARLVARRQTAIVWDDSGKLASFITPHKGIVMDFAHGVLNDVLAEGKFCSQVILHALELCEALRVHGMRYVTDPTTPVSKALGPR